MSPTACSAISTLRLRQCKMTNEARVFGNNDCSFPLGHSFVIGHSSFVILTSASASETSFPIHRGLHAREIFGPAALRKRNREVASRLSGFGNTDLSDARIL